MRRSPVPRTPISLTAAEVGPKAPRTGRTSPWRAAARGVAVLLVPAALAGCMRVGEPDSPRPSPSVRPNGGAVVEAPAMPAGGMGGARRPAPSADDDEAAKNGDESPSASASPSHGESTSRPRPRPSADPSSPGTSETPPPDPSPAGSPSETGSADPEASKEAPAGSAARNVP